MKTRFRFVSRSLFIFALFIFVSGSPNVFAELDAGELGGVPNAVLLEEDIAGGGPPSEEGLRQAREQGVVSVIDFRTPEEGVEEEQKLAEAMGLKYFNIPVSPETLNSEKAAELSGILSDPTNRPALLHCGSGNRVGGVWAIYQHYSQGLPAELAYEIGVQKGMRSDSVKQAVKQSLGMA